MPKYCSTIYRILEMALLRWISKLGELGGGGVLAHDAIFDFVEGQKVPVGFSCVALVGIDLFDLLFCMTTESGAIGEVVGIVDRGRGEGGGQHKTVAGVDRRMFFQTKVGDIIFNRPVGFEVPGELQRFAGFIPLALFGVAVFALLFQLILAQGPLADLTKRASTATPSLMESPCCSNWRRISELIASMACLGSRLRKREKVE